MKAKKIIASGMVIGLLFVIFDMLIAISTSPIYSPYSDLPIWKTPPNVFAGLIFDLINGLILVAVYITIYDGIPGTGWKKGLNYGIIVGLFRVVMTAFSSIVMYNIPLKLIITGLITGYIEIVILCLLLWMICRNANLRSHF